VVTNCQAVLKGRGFKPNFLMNSQFSKSAFALINLAALAVCCTALSARAETGNLPAADTTAILPAQNIDRLSESVATSTIKPDAETTAINKKIDSIRSIELNAGVKSESEATLAADPQPGSNLQVSAAVPEKSEPATSEIAETQNEQNIAVTAETKNSEETTTVADNSVNVQPTVETAEKIDRPNSIVASENSELTAVPEQQEVKTAQEVLKTPVSTSASALTNQPKVAEKSETTDPKVAQVEVKPGRATRSGPSYIGIGGNLGFGGDSALGDTSFAILSKIGLTSNISVRPSLLFRDDLTVLIPVTYDFVSQEAVEVSDDFVITAAPYLGAGVAFSTGDDSNFGFLLSGGVDVPLSSNFTATAGLNVGFLDGTEVGLLLGVGYTFPNIVR
jgi:hypothetical protein